MELKARKREIDVEALKTIMKNSGWHVEADDDLNDVLAMIVERVAYLEERMQQ